MFPKMTCKQPTTTANSDVKQSKHKTIPLYLFTFRYEEPIPFSYATLRDSIAASRFETMFETKSIYAMS